MAEAPPEEPKGAPEPGWTSRLTAVFFVLGSAGLLVAMFTDALAVVGRHVGIPVLGSIEIVQVAIVIAASSAMLWATLRDSHARVRILLERLPDDARRLAERTNNLFSGLVFIALLAGSAWLIFDYWGGYERTELLHLPITPLRIFWCLCAAAIAVVFIVRALRTSDGDHKS